jgi:hypothetical protein
LLKIGSEVSVTSKLQSVEPHLPVGVEGLYRDADKSLARQGSKHATATEDFDVHISYL